MPTLCRLAVYLNFNSNCCLHFRANSNGRGSNVYI